MTTYQKRNIALLIDADNVSSKNLPTIMEQLKLLGNVVVKRAYGNWSKVNLKNWLSASIEHGVTAVQVSDFTAGKNGSDIKIVIDAMEIYFTKEIDTFAIVTSDSDFTNLVSYLVEAGKHVIGFGEPKTPQALISVYHEFRFLLTEYQSTPTTTVVIPPPQSGRNKSQNSDTFLNNFISELIKQHGGAIKMSILGTEIRQHPTIDISKYGCEKISELINKLPNFEIFLQEKTQMVRKTQQPQPTPVENVSIDEITLTNLVSQAIALYQDNTGWVGINRVSQYLQQNHGITNLSYQSLCNMIAKLSVFQVKEENNFLFVKDMRLEETHNEQTTPKTNDTVKKATPDELLANDHLLETIRLSIHETQENGWASMIKVGTVLGQRGFTAKQFGYKNLSELLKAMDIFDVRPIDNVNYVKDVLPKTHQPQVVMDNTTNDNIITVDNQTDSVETDIIVDETNIETIPENVAEESEQISIDIADDMDINHVDNQTDTLIDVTQDEDNQESFDDVTQALIDALSDTATDDETAELSLTDAIMEAIQYQQNAEGWATIGDIGHYLRAEFDIKSSELGYRNIGELIETLADFELKREGRQVFAKVLNHHNS